MKSGYKFSLYNWYIKHSDGLLVHNGVTGALLLVSDPALMRMLSDVQSCNDVNSILNGFTNHHISTLESCGIIMPHDYDELGIIRELLLINKYRMIDDVNTVIITNNCNLNCTYCYQKGSHKTNKISNATIERVAEIIHESRNPFPHVVLYGGEPLLYPSECIKLIRMCSEAAQSRGCILRSSLITNGTLLSHSISRELHEIGLDHVQITIDGDSFNHNAKRKYSDGSGSYTDIIQNVRSSLVPVIVRYNVDHTDTKERYNELQKELEGINNCKLVLAPIVDDKYDICTLNMHIASIIGRYPGRMLGITKMSGICGANATYKYGGGIVACDGRTQRCWNEVGTNIYYGDIFTKMSRNTIAKSLKWFELDLLSAHSKCSSCRMFPGCTGGCLDLHIKQNHTCNITESMYENILLDEYNARSNVSSDSRYKGVGG